MMTTANTAVPLYHRIKDEIRHLIITGALKEGDKIPSISDMTQKHGVSPVTAVRVFKELCQGGYVRNEKGKGYFVSFHHERSSPLKLHGVIGCLIRPYRQTTAYDNYFNEINAGIQKECMKRSFDTLYPGFCLDFDNHDLSPQAVAKLEQSILSAAERVDGLILDERIPDNVLEKIVGKLKVPHVLIFRKSNVPKIKSLVPAYREGAEKVIDLAVKSGYKNFILCTPGTHPTVDSAINSAQVRLNELKKSDPRICSVLIGNCFAKDVDITGKIMSELKANKGRSFILCATDSISRYICDEMGKKGINFGSGLGLLGIGGMGYATMKKPKIATVDTKPFELGQLAVDRIFQEINQRSESIDETVPAFELKLGDTF